MIDKEEMSLTEQAVLVEQERKLKGWQVLWGIVCCPGRTFRQTRGRAGLVLPGILMAGGTFFGTISVALSQRAIIASEIKRQLADLPNTNPEQIERIVSLSNSPAALTIGAIVAVVTILVSWVIQAGILHLAMLVLGGNGVFRQAFEIVGWAWVPLFFDSLVKGVLSLLTGRVPVSQDAGIFYSLLRNTGPAELWNMVLLVIGFSAVYEITKKRVVVPVVGMWLFTVMLDFLGRKF